MQVTISNSVCKVSEFSADQFKKLRQLMSYFEESFHRKGSWNRPVRRYLIDKHGTFPTGLLYILDEYCSANKIKLKINDTRKRPRKCNFGLDAKFPAGVTPYVEQLEAAEAAKQHSRGIISASTGVGKSFIAALIIDKLKLPTLVVVPSLNLKRQLTDSLREIFGEDKVGPWDKTSKLPRHPIVVENVDALSTAKRIPGIGCVIIDEFHRSGAATYRDLNMKVWDDVYYKFGITATPFRSKDQERILLESVLSKVIYSIPYGTAVDKGYIVPLEAYYIDLPIKKLKGRGTNFASVYSECVVNNEELNKIVASMACDLSNNKLSAMVLVKQIEHGVKIVEKMEEEGVFVDYVKGENDDNSQLIRRFNKEVSSVLVGTVGVLGEGVDTKPCEYVILAGGGKSKNAFMQNCGRGFRRFISQSGKVKESCKIIMFRDPSHKWMLEHFKACCKHLRDEYGVTPVRLDNPL